LHPDSKISPSNAGVKAQVRDREGVRCARPIRNKNGGSIMHDILSIEATHTSISALVNEKLKFLIPMAAIYLISFVGLTLLADFAKGVVGTRVIGSVNLGFSLIAFNYLLSWALALIYVSIANDRLDPLAEKAASEVRAMRVNP
jgi:uncharacterized membrane protein (DUF485 family)